MFPPRNWRPLQLKETKTYGLTSYDTWRNMNPSNLAFLMNIQRMREPPAGDVDDQGKACVLWRKVYSFVGTVFLLKDYSQLMGWFQTLSLRALWLAHASFSIWSLKWCHIIISPLSSCIYAWLTCFGFKLPFSSPFPGILSVFVMDNARTHHGEEILELAELYGMFLEIHYDQNSFLFCRCSNWVSTTLFTGPQPHWGSLLNDQSLPPLSSSSLGMRRWCNAVWFDGNHGGCDIFGYFLHAGYFWMDCMNWSIV